MNNPKKNYGEIGAEHQYGHTCPTCGEDFLGAKDHHVCKECAAAWQEKVKELSEEEREAIAQLCFDMSKRVVSFIKTMDITKNGEFDDEEPVVGVNALELPITSGLIDMFYKGYIKGKHNV